MHHPFSENPFSDPKTTFLNTNFAPPLENYALNKTQKTLFLGLEKVARLLTYRWPGYWPYKSLKCGQVFDPTAYIYIYSGVIIWAKFGLLRCYCLGQVCFLQNTVCQKKHYKIGVSALFFWKKIARANLRCYYLGQVGHFKVAVNLAQIITPTWPR